MSVDSKISWETIAIFDLSGIEIEEPWHFVTEFDETWSRLKLVAEGRWSCLGPAVLPCGPNGHGGLPLAPERLLLPSAAAGSLIGRFGGSVLDQDPKNTFAIGSLCFVSCPDTSLRQLFVSLNGAAKGNKKIERAKLEIFGIID